MKRSLESLFGASGLDVEGVVAGLFFIDQFYREMMPDLDHFNDHFIYVSIASAWLNTLKCI